MSKRQLHTFLAALSKTELQEQSNDLYDRFKNVKEFYDFSFNPNEDRRFKEAKLKISREYFPEKGKKAKKRRSVAQKHIIHLLKLEADPVKIADLMLYNIEVAQTYTLESPLKQESFYKSMLTAYRKALEYIHEQYLLNDFKQRIDLIHEMTHRQNWMNKEGFTMAVRELIPA